MDLVIISSNSDFIAIKSCFCRVCAEQKLDAKIIKVYPNSFDPKQFFKYRDEYDLKGYNITCNCSDAQVETLQEKVQTMSIDSSSSEMETLETKVKSVSLTDEQEEICVNYATDLSKKEY